MQLDLALFLRLSRTLEATQSLGQALSEEQQDALKSLDRVFLTVAEMMELVRTREVAQPTAQPAMEVADLEETRELPPDEETPPEVPTAAEAAPQVWTTEHDRLYEDVLWLFKVGDNEGALISLGRLLNVASDTPELQRFMEINEPKLVGLYERILGSFEQPLVVSADGLGDRFFWDVEEAQALLSLARAKGQVKGLLEDSQLSTMKTLALVHRFQLEGLFSFGHDKARTSAN